MAVLFQGALITVRRVRGKNCRISLSPLAGYQLSGNCQSIANCFGEKTGRMNCYRHRV